MWQYKDLTIFVGVIVVIAVLEGKIKSFLEIETDDLKKMSMGAFWLHLSSIFLSSVYFLLLGRM